MTIEDAVKLVNDKYRDNKPKRWIHDPVAYTLYEVWKIADSKEVYSPSYATAQPTTKAERIRGMTDDELADLLCEVSTCEKCRVVDECAPGVNGWLDWLREPVDGGDGDG